MLGLLMFAFTFEITLLLGDGGATNQSMHSEKVYHAGSKQVICL